MGLRREIPIPSHIFSFISCIGSQKVTNHTKSIWLAPPWGLLYWVDMIDRFSILVGRVKRPHESLEKLTFWSFNEHEKSVGSSMEKAYRNNARTNLIGLILPTNQRHCIFSHHDGVSSFFGDCIVSLRYRSLTVSDIDRLSSMSRWRSPNKLNYKLFVSEYDVNASTASLRCCFEWWLSSGTWYQLEAIRIWVDQMEKWNHREQESSLWAGRFILMNMIASLPTKWTWESVKQLRWEEKRSVTYWLGW